MKSNKVIVVLIAFLVIFAFLFYWLVGRERVERNNYQLVMITENEVTWNCYGSSWEKKTNINDYNWKKMDVFIDGKYSGKYYIYHDDQWYLYDDNKEAVDINGNFLAIESNFDVNAVSFEMSEIEDNEYVVEELENKGLSTGSQLTVNDETKVDIDNDGKEETLYVISNTFPIDFDTDFSFSYVFMEKDGQIYDVFSNESDNMYTAVRPFINAIIDTNNDGIYEILISTAEYSNQGQGHILYEWKNNTFQKIIEN